MTPVVSGLTNEAAVAAEVRAAARAALPRFRVAFCSACMASTPPSQPNTSRTSNPAENKASTIVHLVPQHVLRVMSQRRLSHHLAQVDAYEGDEALTGQYLSSTSYRSHLCSGRFEWP